MSTQAGKNPKRLIESTVASIPQESNRTDEGRQELKGGTNAKESEHTDERRPGPSQQDAEEARETLRLHREETRAVVDEQLRGRSEMTGE